MGEQERGAYHESRQDCTMQAQQLFACALMRSRRRPLCLPALAPLVRTRCLTYMVYALKKAVAVE